MSERILKALMQLFAIVAKIDVLKESDEIVAAKTNAAEPLRSLEVSSAPKNFEFPLIIILLF